MNRKLIYWFLLFLIFLTGCSAGSETPLEVVDTATVSPTSLPTDTPTPLAPVGVFLTPEGADQDLVGDLGSLIGEYIKEEGLRYQVLPDLSASDLQNETFAIVVAIPPFPDLAALAESAPDTKFLAIGFNELSVGDNLSVLGSGGADYDVQGFIAGYIAAMITADWRVGALSVQENPNALAARDGFRTGVKYYCGLCNPKYAPIGINYLYPKYIDLPVGATDPEISANIDYLVDRVVNTYYIVPGVGTPQIYRALIGYEKNIIGSGIDYREEYRDYWVASLEYDLVTALVEFWPRFLEVETGLEELPPLLITDVNSDLLSEGKLNLVEKILEEVQGGYIKTSYD
jgi:hypothetical protein